MSTDLDHPITVVSPRTGEVLGLDASTADLGGYLADVREHESLLREAKNLVSHEILRRMEADGGHWTIHTENGLKLTGSSATPVEEWDGAELREHLLGLVDEKVLTIGAVDAVVETVVSFKVKKAGINSLRSLGSDHPAARVVNELAHEVSKTRYVKVERA